jgi:hypothetical protein
VTRIFARAFAIFGIRWVRSWGYRGGRPGVVIAIAVVVAIAAATGTAIWANGQFHGFRSIQFRGALAAVVLLMLFFAAGPVLLLTESIRSAGSRIQAVLSSLPLTGREITLLMWLPTFIVSVLLLALLWLPGAAAVSGLKFSTNVSVVGALLALLSGYSFAGFIIVLVRVLLSRGTWSQVQYPVMVLGWMGVTALEIWRAGTPFASPNLQLGDYLLLIPWLLRQTTLDFIPGLEVWVVAVATVVAIGLLVWSTSLPSEGKHVAVLWQWSPRWRPSLITLELTRILRARHLVANLVGAELIIVGTCIGLWRLPLELRPFIQVPLIEFMMLTTGLPLLAIRGLTPGRTPVPLLLGYSPARWATSQIVAGVFLGVAAAAPGILGFAALGVAPATIAQYAIPTIVAASGVAIALGWSVPASADNPIGQITGAFLLVLVLGAVLVFADHVFPSGSLVWSAFLVAVGALGIAWAVTLERDRWARVVSHAMRRVA